MQTLSRCHRDRCIILPSRIGWRATSFIVCSRRIRHWQFKPARKVKSCCAQSSAAKEPSRTCRWSAVIPCLCEPLIEAVRQWRYRPYVLNGEAVEVETQVTVNFVLSGG